MTHSQICGATYLQTDDTINFGTESFKVLEAKDAEQFKNKPTENLIT